MKVFLLFIFSFNASSFADTNLLGTWVVTDGYCQDGSEMNKELTEDINSNIDAKVTRVFSADGTTSITTTSASFFSQADCRAEAISTYYADIDTGILITTISHIKIEGCPATNVASKILMSGLSLLGQTDVVFNYEIIDDSLHLVSPYISGEPILSCGDSSRVVRILERQD